MKKKDLPLFELLRPIIIKNISKKIILALTITSGPLTKAITIVVGILIDKLLKPVWIHLRALGLFVYDVKRVKRIAKKIEQAETQDERIDSFNDLP